MGKTQVISGAIHDRAKARSLQKFLQDGLDNRGTPGVPLILQDRYDSSGDVYNIPGWAKGVRVERAARLSRPSKKLRRYVQWVLVATEERGH